MSFGKRLADVRKDKGLSQEVVAKHLGTKAPVIGRYERDEMKPSIDTATKLADLLEVSLDYLVGKTDIELDNTTLQRILEVQNLPLEVKEKLFYFIDMSIRDFKAKKAYS
ncbi:helix-turn-helix transcriptional regulator [uncultured Aquimarina sp.]|uniref:helix-turn-helix domain-containing protein n=1 Tax=uncultured Aquimarina sp. TaxID=575652 RepID=UPI002615E8E6|nr:helix-turn-helix transcriptional regulator [uncultured Aquimarina sp.]